ncbi:MAG: tRNA guanosine(34) transglycosylase Tgt [Rhabdochlamydiaceae bacterium]
MTRTNPHFRFEIIHQSKKSKARIGRIHTPHGLIDTPNFVAVGTNGTLKALDNQSVNQLELQLMFCNTYHMLLQPGPEIVKKAGGLHKFINRKGPLITDSGGFQVFSLAYGSVASELKSKGCKKAEGGVLKINEEGVLFRSYRDGNKILLTPESSVQAQKDLGADIIIPLDELPPYHIQEKDLLSSLDRTHRWEKRSLLKHLENPAQQAMYAVIHGGINCSLRKLSIDTLSSLPFDGFAIGGSLGKNKKEMIDMLTFTMDHLPYESPNHLLGIGDLESIQLSIPLGIDTFDSSYPTRAARHGIIFTKKGPLNVTKAIYKEDFSGLEVGCVCQTCQHYSKSYLHHLFKAKEMTAMSLASLHNIAFMIDLMKRYRQNILEDRI